MKLIKSKKEYNSALVKIYTLLNSDVKKGTKEADEIEVLSLLIENYEKKHFPMDAPNPIEAIKFILEQSAMPETELNKILGGRSRKSEVLSGKRKLSLSMIRELHAKLNIPAESLIAAY